MVHSRMIGVIAYDLDGDVVMTGQQAKAAPDRFIEGRTTEGNTTVFELTAERGPDGRHVYRQLHPELVKFTNGWQPGRKRASYRPN